MPSNKQRREAARRHLERQLQRRQEREARRKQLTLIFSIVGTVLLVVLVAGFIAIVGGEDDDKTPAANDGTPTSSVSPTGTTPTPTSTYPAAKGPAVSFEGVTVTGAADLKGRPGVTSKSTKPVTKLVVKDLVVGKGKAATPTSKVTVQYVGARHKDGFIFDESWKRGQPIEFSLTGVVKGFTEGIGGNAAGVAPMKEGGRRIIVMPSAMGYGADSSNPDIPPNSDLVFVVDLVKIA